MFIWYHLGMGFNMVATFKCVFYITANFLLFFWESLFEDVQNKTKKHKTINVKKRSSVAKTSALWYTGQQYDCFDKGFFKIFKQSSSPLTYHTTVQPLQGEFWWKIGHRCKQERGTGRRAIMFVFTYRKKR